MAAGTAAEDRRLGGKWLRSVYLCSSLADAAGRRRMFCSCDGGSEVIQGASTKTKVSSASACVHFWFIAAVWTTAIAAASTRRCGRCGACLRGNALRRRPKDSLDGSSSFPPCMQRYPSTIAEPSLAGRRTSPRQHAEPRGRRRAGDGDSKTPLTVAEPLREGGRTTPRAMQNDSLDNGRIPPEPSTLNPEPRPCSKW